MFGTVKTGLCNERGVMRAAAEGARLAGLSFVVIRKAGCVPVTVKAERGKKLFRSRSERSLNLREFANICGVNGPGCRECGNEEKGC